MPRPIRFWHSTALSLPWRADFSRDADSGEDELYTDSEIAPHELTPSPGWRKTTPTRFEARVGTPKVEYECPVLPAEPEEKMVVDLVEWHRILQEGIRDLAKIGKKWTVSGPGIGYTLDGARCSLESWEVVAVPDDAQVLFSTTDGSNGVLLVPGPTKGKVTVFGAELVKAMELETRIPGLFR